MTAKKKAASKKLNVKKETLKDLDRRDAKQVRGGAIKADVNAITKVMISQDTRTIVFNYRRVLSELFVVEPTSR